MRPILVQTVYIVELYCTLYFCPQFYHLGKDGKVDWAKRKGEESHCGANPYGGYFA